MIVATNLAGIREELQEMLFIGYLHYISTQLNFQRYTLPPTLEWTTQNWIVARKILNFSQTRILSWKIFRFAILLKIQVRYALFAFAFLLTSSPNCCSKMARWYMRAMRLMAMIGRIVFKISNWFIEKRFLRFIN